MNMGKLREEEINKIVRRATLFQKFYGSPSYKSESKLESEYPDLFEITDSLKLKRAFVAEALIEHQGIPVEEPFILDGGLSEAKVVGFANGQIDPETAKELKAQIEYHFNNRGEIKHRKGKTIWKAMPDGFSRFIATHNSPEVTMEQTGQAIKIQARQSLKTFNKFYFPMLVGIFAAIMFFGASVFGAMESEEEVGIIMAGIFGFGSFLYSRFMKRRKQKRKDKLVDLVDRLQQILERRRKAGTLAKPAISIPEADEYEGTDEIEISEREKESNQ